MAYLDELNVACESQVSSTTSQDRSGATHLLVAKIQELVKLDAAVRERAERPLLLELSGESGVGDFSVLFVIRNENRARSIFRPPNVHFQQ